MKLFLTSLLICLISSVRGQPRDNYRKPIKYDDYITSEIIVGANTTSPLIGIGLQRYVYDDKFNFFIPLQVAYFQHTFKKPNYFYIQMGLAFNINSHIDLGVNLMNLQAELPKKNSTELGYDSPISTFIRLKNKHYQNTFVNFEYSYSMSRHQSDFRVIFKKNIYKIKP